MSQAKPENMKNVKKTPKGLAAEKRQVLERGNVEEMAERIRPFLRQVSQPLQYAQAQAGRRRQ